MIRIDIKLLDGRTIPAFIRPRTYRQLVGQKKNLSFIEKLKSLFSRKEKTK